MNNFWITIKHTARNRLTSKAFVWSTILISLIVIGLMNVENLITAFGGDEETDTSTVAVISETENEEVAELLTSLDSGDLTYLNYADEDTDSAIQAAENDEIDYVLELSGAIQQLEAEFFRTGSDFMLGQQVQMDVQRVKETVVTNELGLDEEELSMIYNPISFQESSLGENDAVQTEETHMQSYWMVYGLVFVIYMIIILFGSIIATEVATEKSSR